MKARDFGTEEFAGGVDDAKRQRGDERALEAAVSADRDHDQEQHEIAQRVERLERQHVGADDAAEARQRAAADEGDR